MKKFTEKVCSRAQADFNYLRFAVVSGIVMLLYVMPVRWLLKHIDSPSWVDSLEIIIRMQTVIVLAAGILMYVMARLAIFSSPHDRENKERIHGAAIQAIALTTSALLGATLWNHCYVASFIGDRSFTRALNDDFSLMLIALIGGLLLITLYRFIKELKARQSSSSYGPFAFLLRTLHVVIFGVSVAVSVAYEAGL